MKNTRFKLLTGAAGLLIALAALILLNVAISPLRLRADLTSDKLYTLSDGTRALLQHLERDVTLKFYFSRSADAAPINFKQYGSRITDLLREYQSLSRGRLTLEILDPEPDSDAEEWAQRYGLTASRLDPAGNLPPVFLGLVALSGAKQSSIPFFSPADEPQVEFLITRAVHDVTVAKKPKLAVISPLPIMGNEGMFMGQRPDPWIVINELRAVAEVTDLSADIESIPEDIDTLLLVYPRNLPETTLYAVDQFVLRGGHLFAMGDPLNLTELNSQNPNLGDPSQTHADLNRLTSAWGVTMETDRVVADARAATRISRPDGSTERHLSWLTLRPENFNKQEVASAALNMMQIPMAGWFKTTPVEGLTLTPLITAGPDAGSMTTSEAVSGIPMGESSFRKEPGPMPIALRISGHFKTAFPDGRPKDPKKPEQAADTSHPTTQLMESSSDGAVVLVADADFLYDSFAGRKLTMFGPGVYQLMNDNINFAANVAGQLGGGDALIGLRGRGTFERPFTRVIAMQASAQEKWRNEEIKLQERLRSTQMRLNELQAGKSGDQKMIISPEQRQEIGNFQNQLADTRKELKEVRKNLRKEIEDLGTRIKVANIAAMPALVILFGIAHGWRRRRKAKG